jgi:hypothetical protein
MCEGTIPVTVQIPKPLYRFFYTVNEQEQTFPSTDEYLEDIILDYLLSRRNQR